MGSEDGDPLARRDRWAAPRTDRDERTAYIGTTTTGIPIPAVPQAAELRDQVPVLGTSTTPITLPFTQTDRERLAAAGRRVPHDLFGGLNRVDARIVAILGSLTVGTAPVLMGLSGQNPATVVVFRAGLAILPLAVLACIEWRRNGTMRGKHVLLHLLAGAFFGIDMGLWSPGVHLAGAGIASAAANLQVIIVPLLAWLIFRERLPVAFIVAVPVMLAGVVLLSGVLEQGSFSSDLFAGVLLSVAGGFGYAGYIIILSRAPAPGHAATQVLLSTCSAMVVGTVLASAFGLPDLTPGFWPLMCLLGLALFGQVIGWIATSNALPRLASSTGSMLLLIQPLVAIFGGMLLLGERISLL